MVQIFERGPSRGALQAQILGEGFKGAGEATGKLINRYETQNALENVRKMAKDPAANPVDILLDMYKEMSKTKQGAKIMPELSRMILQQRQIKNEFGNDEELVPGNEPKPSMQKNPVTGEMVNVAPLSSSQEMPAPVQYPTSGVLPAIIPEDQIEAQARAAAGSQNDLQRYQTKRSELESRNNNAQNAVKMAEDKASKYVSGPDEVPEFIDLGRQFGYMTDLNQWERATAQKWHEYKSNKERMQNAFVPGFFRGLITSKKSREESLKKLQPTFKDMQNAGMEQYARKIAANQGLSPTEIQELAHPISQQQKLHLKNFKPYPADIKEDVNELERISNRVNDDLTNFFKGQLKPDTSLSVLRHHLWDEKNAPWDLIGPAIRKAAAETNYTLTPDQEREMTEIETVPPRQSLSGIFQDWWGPIEFIKGAK